MASTPERLEFRPGLVSQVETLPLVLSAEERVILRFLIFKGGEFTTAEITAVLLSAKLQAKSKGKLNEELRKLCPEIFAKGWAVPNYNAVQDLRGFARANKIKLPDHSTIKGQLDKLKTEGILNERVDRFKKGKSPYVISKWSLTPVFAAEWLKRKKELIAELEKLPKWRGAGQRASVYDRNYLSFFGVEDLADVEEA